VRVTIIGWYGTETIGDRAILAGILTFLSDLHTNVEIQLGSLYPFFTQRTLREDMPLWSSLCRREIPVSLFNSSNPGELRRAINSSDLLMMGGGPLMDLREMHIMAYAFKYARRRKVMTATVGCGIGPLDAQEYKKAASAILGNSDVAIFRDTYSLKEAEKLCPGIGERAHAAIDPAAYCAMKFKELNAPFETKNVISVNFRDVAGEYKSVSGIKNFMVFAADLVKSVMDENPDYKVKLIPNHYFFFGGDDRVFLNGVKYKLGSRELLVQNRPLSLSSTMESLASSAACIGMRYHSILLMALLNGRCRIMNYTGTAAGKICGFLSDFDPDSYFTSDRMLDLDSAPLKTSFVNGLVSDKIFPVPEALLNNAFGTYRSVLTTMNSL